MPFDQNYSGSEFAAAQLQILLAARDSSKRFQDLLEIYSLSLPSWSDSLSSSHGRGRGEEIHLSYLVYEPASSRLFLGSGPGEVEK